MSKYCSPLEKVAEITDFLYLGGLAAARMEDVLTKKGITCVINGKVDLCKNDGFWSFVRAVHV